MDSFWLLFLDRFFIIFHTLYTIFNLFGWIWKKTRKLNLILQLTTLSSWVGLGIFFGWGYCFLTDWHWKVRMGLGYRNMPRSYVKFMADLLTGKDWEPGFVNIMAVTCFSVALLCSLLSNFLDWRKKRKFLKNRENVLS